ncbi:MAG: CpaF family protein [Lachnospiraceae bacterium]|nr:CpaF family protein [Lachnospiraceae bacterium]
MGERKRELREQILKEITYERQMSDEELCERIDGEIMACARAEPMPLKEKLKLQKELFDSFRRLDVLQELVDNPQITEIMVNGPDTVFVESGGKIRQWEKVFESREQLLDLIGQIVSRVNRIVNTASPIADARLPDGSRVHVVLEPIALNGPILTIRKFPEPITMKRLLEYRSISEEAAELLKLLAAARYNIFVSGGTGAGKTTFLNALSEFIPAGERVITIEDSAELKLSHIANLVRLETRDANAQGEGAIGVGALIRAALRMRPDRVIIGEVRGKEALELLQAMNTGHDGSFSTGHANGPKDMLSRLETMVLMGAELPLAAIRSQIASAVEIMVHVARLRDRSRKVVAIEEVDRFENGEILLNPLFSFQEEEPDKGAGGERCRREERVAGELKRVGTLKHWEKLKMAGYSI